VFCVGAMRVGAERVTLFGWSQKATSKVGSGGWQAPRVGGVDFLHLPLNGEDIANTL